MILRVTDKIKRGEIVFPTVGYAVKAGTPLVVGDEDYYASDIQHAIRAGFLVVEDKQEHDKSSHAKRILVRNISGRPLGLDNLSLLAGEEKFVSEKEIQSTNIRIAVDNGMIEIEKPEDESEPEAEEKAEADKPVKKSKTSKKSSKKKSSKKKTTKKKTTKKKTEVIAGAESIDLDAEPDENVNPVDEQDPNPEHTMQSWDPHAKQMLSKDESEKAITHLHDKTDEEVAEAEDSVQTGKVDFDKPKIQLRASTGSKAEPDGKKGLKPVGKVKKLGDTAYLDQAPRVGDLDFVDIEQRQERIQGHPHLAKLNEEVE